ncbi:MAG: efflux RND transporter periplasmic adaptor subunit [Pirellulaceae bacterium]|nr:efflux RND transporter periplasmic adaptor subunit [Pirellulaceae bacterium]
MTKFTWRILKLITVAVVVTGAVLWFVWAPVPVRRHSVVRGPIATEVMGTGTLEARYHVTISPKIAGLIAEVLVDQGSEVKHGQPLVRLIDEDLRQQVGIAEATVATAEAALLRVEADRTQTAAILIQSKTEFGRAQKLMRSNALSQAEFDKTKESLDIATSGVARAGAVFAEAQQQIVLAQRTLSFQQARLAEARLLAPFDGVIIERFRDAGSIAVPGTPVLSMISKRELWISAWVDETEMSRLGESQPARIVFRSEPDKSYRGKVTRLGLQADRETREFTVDVQTLELPTNWAIGQRAEVYIEIEKNEDAILVPMEYIIRRQGATGVFVVQDSYASWRPVKFRLMSTTHAEVVDGVSEGDELAIPRLGQTNLDAKRVVSK